MSKKLGTVLVAMSGGVDSAVAAALMLEKGYDVIGMTMQIWPEAKTDDRHSGCCSLGAVEDARRSARALGIPHYVVNFREEFQNKVIDNFVEEYSRGRTPNPCVRCNRFVKFETLLAQAKELGCSKLVTGHYARVEQGADGWYRLLMATHDGKDQSYALYSLNQEQLSYLEFPIGDLPDKSVTRSIAAKHGLHVANKPDSQEICFVKESGGYVEFIKKVSPNAVQEGELVTSSGTQLGKHTGVAALTVGQRRGLAVASPNGKPLYVLKLDPGNNKIVVGEEHELLREEVSLEDVHFNLPSPLTEPLKVQAKIRYNMAPRSATLHGGKEPKLVFDEPVRAVTPGQIAVAYVDKAVVAGGTICGDN